MTSDVSTPCRPFQIRILKHRVARAWSLPKVSGAGGPKAILHDDWVDKVATRETSPSADAVELAPLYDIERIERINRLHEPLTSMTGHPIHVTASPSVTGSCERFSTTHSSRESDSLLEETSDNIVLLSSA